MQKIDITIVGDVYVGKSSLVAGIKKQKQITSTTIGVEVDFLTYKNTKLCFWDTSGQTDFRQFISSYYKKANVIVIVVTYDQIHRFTYWYDTIKTHTPDKPIILCINKIDRYGGDFVVPDYVKDFDCARVYLTSMYIREKGLSQAFDYFLSLGGSSVCLEDVPAEVSTDCCIIV